MSEHTQQFRNAFPIVLGARRVAKPNLCFEGLGKLYSLMLDGFVPGALVLAKVTALHLRLYSLEDAKEDVWASHASRLRSVCVVATSAVIDAAAKLPDFLLTSGMSHLKSLTLFARSIGCKQAPFRLHGVFVQVQELHLRTIEGMHLDIPGELFPWRAVHIRSHSDLSIRMRSVPDFANSCRIFSFGYANLQGVDLVRMCSFMSAEGMPWEHGAEEGCSYVLSPGVPLSLKFCWDVESMWELLEFSHLDLDGILPGPTTIVHSGL